MLKETKRVLMIVFVFCILFAFVANASECTDESNTMSLREALLEKCSPKEIIALIQAGADVNQPSEAGYYPLFTALSFNYGVDVIEAFLAAGADPHVLQFGDTALLCAVLNQHDDQTEIIKLLLEEGINVKARDSIGQTALHWATAANAMIAGGITENPEIIKLLLDAGADPNTRDIKGRTPLMIAANYSQNPKIISLLLAAGADKTLKCIENKTAFDYARENEKLWGPEILLTLSKHR